MEYYTATKRNELLVHAYIWMNLIGIKLSEKNQKKFMYDFIYMTFSSVQPLIHVRFFVTPWTVARQASLSITNSQSLLKLMFIELVMPSNHLILCRPLLLPPSIFPSIRVFSSESVHRIRWPNYWSFSFSISPSNEYLGLISFRMDWFWYSCSPRTLKSILQHHSSKGTILWCSTFFIIQEQAKWINAY